jgi:hypothetical protein
MENVIGGKLKLKRPIEGGIKFDNPLIYFFDEHVLVRKFEASFGNCRLIIQ